MPYKNKKDQKEWFKKNPKARKLIQKKYRETHKKEIIVYGKTYQKRKNELERIKTANRTTLQKRIYNCVRNANKRAFVLGVKGKITEEQVEALFKSYSNVCIGCFMELPGLDHVIPLSKGGLNIIENCQPLGLNCNVAKNIGCTDFRKRKKYE